MLIFWLVLRQIFGIDCAILLIFLVLIIRYKVSLKVNDPLLLVEQKKFTRILRSPVGMV